MVHFCYPSVHIRKILVVSESSKIKQFRLIIVTNCEALTLCMNISYIVGHEWVDSTLFQYIMPFLYVNYLTMFSVLRWYSFRNCVSSVSTNNILMSWIEVSIYHGMSLSLWRSGTFLSFSKHAPERYPSIYIQVQ
jgi:hypothetical protein